MTPHRFVLRALASAGVWGLLVGGCSSGPPEQAKDAGAQDAGGPDATVECVRDIDCGLTEFCGVRHCHGGHCTLTSTPPGTPCGVGVCDGMGACVQCLVGPDCFSGICREQRCLDPTCTDSIRNGQESDIDCGGDCEPCTNGQRCDAPDDCASNICLDNACEAPPPCSDGELSPGETDVDCGGSSCSPCEVSELCLVAADCVTYSCDVTCQPASCSDGVQNGLEVGVDCGWACSVGCPAGTPCNVAADCDSHVCDEEVCAAPACDDGVWNGDEAYYDCGAACPTKCRPGYPCFVGADCAGGECDPIMLHCMPNCADGVLNNGESDIDCGGPCPAGCDELEHCFDNDDCLSDVCDESGHCASG